jgi:hypothetical protein
MAQITPGPTQSKKDSKKEKKERRDAIIKQEEEGNLVFTRQNGFGIQLRTNGYGIFFEVGRRKTPRMTNIYNFELTEIKHDKEEKVSGSTFFSNPYIYGKINNFYQFKLGYGKQYVLGQKGNKNGVAVLGIFQGGLSLGLLKPYYINTANGTIKYSEADSAAFLNVGSNSSAGFLKGWGELKIRPGAYIKTALRFDIGRFNESVNAIEIGMSLDAYAQKIDIMAPVTNDRMAVGPQRFFFQGHIALVFGRRK